MKSKPPTQWERELLENSVSHLQHMNTDMVQFLRDARGRIEHTLLQVMENGAIDESNFGNEEIASMNGEYDR